MKLRCSRLTLAALAIIALTLASFSAVAQAAPGGHSPEEVNESIKKGVAYIDTQQNADGSYGTSFPVAETGMSLLAYGVLANGNFESLSTTYQEHVKKGVEYLLNTQAASGAWEGFETYYTGIAIAGLEAFKGVNAGIPAAIAKGREFLVEKDFQGKARTGCSSGEPPGTGAEYCGGWNYDTGAGRSDESNTGFAIFGLHQTGGVPTTVAEENLGWQHHIQEISTNPFATRNDGGGSYVPGINFGGFSSNANDTGSMLDGFAYDGLTEADEGVKAGIKLGEDILNVYELEKEVLRQGVYHEGASEDGSCMIGSAGCDWQFNGDGGYHYSLFALTKGLGEFIESKLEDASNWYAKVVDLLLTQQAPNGSWPADARDDATVLFATGLSVSSLGLVGVAEPTETTTSLSGGGQSGAQITVPEGTAVTDQATLTGANATKASNTVEYKVYSDSECKVPFTPAGTVTVSGGKVPPSNPQTLPQGTWYWQATYSGDKANKGSSSTCSAEKETVEARPTSTLRQQKEAVLQEFEALLPTCNRDDRHHIEAAIKDLKESLDPKLWVDDSHLSPKHGEKVFQEEKQAVDHVHNLKGPAAGAVEGLAGQLVEIDQALAQTAIEEATDPKAIAEANKEMEKAAQALEKGKPGEAIEHYKQAWKRATKP